MIAFITALCLALFAGRVEAADLKPIGGISLFGGAEREPEENAGGIGGLELVGFLPVSEVLGLQGSVYTLGGHGFRGGLNAGPVLKLGNASKAGVFVDYEHRAWHDNDFVNVRGAAAYYLNRATLELTYSHPVSSEQTDATSAQVAINKLTGVLRLYPTPDVEVKMGLQGNSFAGEDRGRHGIGGVFGLSFKLFDPLVVNLVDFQMDDQDRYRVASGIQFIFGSTLQEWRAAHLPTDRITTKTVKRSMPPVVDDEDAQGSGGGGS